MLKSVEYRRVYSFGDAAWLAGEGYLNPAVLDDLQSSWFYVGDPRLTDMPEFFGPFFAMLGLAGATTKASPLRVLDFGGATGRYGTYADAFFKGRIKFDWAVVETAMYVERGRADNHAATFHASLDELTAAPDVAMFSGALQYVADWKAVLSHPLVRGAPILYLCRTPIGEPAAFVQTIEYDSGKMAVPGRIFCREEISAVLSETHRLFSSFHLEHDMGELGVVPAPAQIWLRN